MKKIFFLCAALVAAMTMSAAEANPTPMTCAEAAAAAMLLPENNKPGTELVIVTGYVTTTDGVISRGQQTFWMDDQKGTKQTFEGYWCNIPGAEGSNGDPLNVGDKVSITGYLMKYNTTPEIKNGDVTIIERAVVKIDTIEATVCEAYAEGEALNAGENTQDVFIVKAMVESVDKVDDTNFQATFWMACDDKKKLEAYNVSMEDKVLPLEGDSVLVTGKVKKYGETIEMIGKAKVTKKGGTVVDTIKVNVAEAVEIGLKLEKGKSSKDVYIVEGYADSIAYAYSEEKKTMSFYMCDEVANPTYEFEVYNSTVEKEVKVGDKVYAVGNLMYYYKAADGDKPEINLIEISKGKVFFQDPTTGVEQVVFEGDMAIKVLENGQIYIVKDGVRYNLLGAQVK